MSPANPHQHHQRPQHQTYIVKLNPADVVLGRGAGPNEHSGNIAFREIVLDLKPSYTATVNRKMKSRIASKVVKAIRARGGRFLKRAPGREDDVFVLADEDVVVEKAKQALRHGRCTVKPRKGRVSSVSSVASTTSTACTAASHSGSVMSPMESLRNAAMVFANPPPTPSPAVVPPNPIKNNNLLTMTLLAQQCNVNLLQVPSETVNVSNDAPSLPSSRPPVFVPSSNHSLALQESSTYQLTLQLLMALAESKRRESSTAEALQLVELAEVLIATKRAKETVAKVDIPVPVVGTPEASILPCNLVAQLLLSQQQEQQSSFQSPQHSLVFPTSYGAAPPCVTDINARLLNESKLSILSLPQAM